MAGLKVTPRQVERMADKDVRKMYSRLRKLANTRTQRLERAGYGDYDVSQIFPVMKGLTPQQIREELVDVSYYLADPRTTMGGMKHYVAATLGTLHESGYSFVNAGNLKQFGDFMEAMRSRFNGRMFDSDRMVRAYGEFERLGVSNSVVEKHFASYLQDSRKVDKLIDTLEGLDVNPGASSVSSGRILAALNKR